MPQDAWLITEQRELANIATYCQLTQLAHYSLYFTPVQRATYDEPYTNSDLHALLNWVMQTETKKSPEFLGFGFGARFLDNILTWLLQRNTQFAIYFLETRSYSRSLKWIPTTSTDSRNFIRIFQVSLKLENVVNVVRIWRKCEKIRSISRFLKTGSIKFRFPKNSEVAGFYTFKFPSEKQQSKQPYQYQSSRRIMRNRQVKTRVDSRERNRLVVDSY